MGRLVKKYLGLIIVGIIVLVFPISLSNQARLNNRIIVTGLAIDKSEDKYQITAQYVKTSPGSESAGGGAEINFISDSDSSMVGAIEKLAYKSGKVASFSHTNFIVIGKDCLSEDLTQMLDYFVRNKTIKSSAMLLFAEDKASDEIKNTKDIELSVGLGLQKVFLVKENEGDGEMTTIIDFLKDSKSFSKCSTASTLKLMKNEEQSGESSDTSQNSSENNTQSNNVSSSGAGSSGDSYKYFEALAPIVCFCDGKFIGKLETADEVSGYMIVKHESEGEDISLVNINGGRFENAVVGIKVNHKATKKSIRFENSVPCLDVKISINNSEIEDLQNKELISEISSEEYEILKQEMIKSTQKRVAACFEKAKSFGMDIFRAYDIANKFQYHKTNKYYSDVQSFLNNLKLNVEVEVFRLDY